MIMNKHYLFFIFLLLSVGSYGQNQLQPDTKLAKQLEESRNLRITMVPDQEDSGYTRWKDKEVLNSRKLPIVEDFEKIQMIGVGTLHLDKQKTISGKGSVRMDTPTSLAVRASRNRAYSIPKLFYPLNREDLRDYNRFSAWIYIDAPGIYLIFGGVALHNEGEKVMPTPGRFEGEHFETFIPGKWQQVIWEIPDLYRDCVTGFSVCVLMPGEPAGAENRMSVYVDDMRIEKVEAENSRGFDLRKDAMAYSHSGYKSDARKQALVQNVKNTSFKLRNTETENIAYEGQGKALKNGFVEMDFSDLKTPGQYTIEVDNITSKPFLIGDNAYLSMAWKTLNFFFAERCGYDQPGIHQECHQDVFCVHLDGRKISIAGGWHDAADLTIGAGNMTNGIVAMLELADAVKDKSRDLYDRTLEEARWGLNWILRTRFGDGYRHGGHVMAIWTKNINGDKDDMVAEARNSPTDNLASATCCAMAAPYFEESDPVFARWCRNSAIEDFKFAIEAMGMDASLTAERSAMTTVAAMQLYRLTKDPQYLDWGVRYANNIMDCQQMERRKDWSMPLRGFF